MDETVMFAVHSILGLFSVANLIVVVRAAWTLSERLTRIDTQLLALSTLPAKVELLDKRVTKVEYDLNALFQKLREADVISHHEGMRRIHEDGDNLGGD